MKITESYCTNNNRYKAANKFMPQGVVLHSIGCPQPRARVLYNNWQNNPSAYATHYMVDDTEILHCIPDNYICYHVCSPGNSKWIGIEMGEPSQIKYKTGATFDATNLSAAQAYCEKTYKNAVWLIAYLCKKYGWNPETDVYTHYEVTTKKLSNTDHVDPQHLWDGLGMGYNLAKLRKDVRASMSGINISTTPTSTPSSSSSSSSSASSTSSRPVLKQGSTGEYVRKLQTSLNKLGYNCGTVDGSFGSKTVAAVKSFQTKNKLTSDGIVGDKTWIAIDKAEEALKNKAPTNTNTTVSASDMYRIRKSWTDASSQIGAYKNLQSAISECKDGYKVYDSNGKQVYPKASFNSYMVRVTASTLNIRSGSGTNYPIVGTINKGGGYTIVDEENGFGLLKSYEKGRNGWISLGYVEKIN